MTYEVFSIPIPPTKIHLENYKTLRLLSLKTNPEAFGSTYEGEISFTEEKWRMRLEAHGRTTFIARRCAKPQASDKDRSSPDGEAWVATASLLSPEMLATAEITPPECAMVDNKSVYAVVGMWVNPAHRRQGLGKRLIEAIFASIRNNPDSTTEKVVLLEVHDDNEKAKALYTSFGFVAQDGNEEVGESWMTLTIE